MRRGVWAAAFLCLWPAARALAQTPLGGEFRVNGSTTDTPYFPEVAADAAGNFVVVWNGRWADSTTGEIIGRLFDAQGNPRSADFLVNADTPFAQGRPHVAFDSAGSFVVTWTSLDQDGSGDGVFARRFAGQGNPLTGEFQVNTYTMHQQSTSRVATGVGGEFVIVWQGNGPGGSYSDVFGQRFDGAGNRLGPEFLVNADTFNGQYRPNIAADGSGNFVVVWESRNYPGTFEDGVHARRFDAAGNPRGGEFRVDQATTGAHREPIVISEPAGAFTVAWQRTPPAANPSYIWTRRYDGQGQPLGGESLVSGAANDQRDHPAMAADANGNPLVVWAGRTLALGTYDVMARQLDCDGQALGPEFIVNTQTDGSQYRPSVAGTAGNFVIIWQNRQVGEIVGRRFRGLPACGRFYTLTPCRLADTRDPPGPSGGPALIANSARDFPVGGSCAIPANARAVALNVTTVGQTDIGDLRLFPAGQPPPLASAINFVVNRARANNAVVPVGAGGRIGVHCDMPSGSAGSTHLVLDVYGYFR